MSVVFSALSPAITAILLGFTGAIMGSYLATVALHFPFRNPVTASVLLGTAKPSSLARNIEALARSVDPAVFAACETFALR